MQNRLHYILSLFSYFELGISSYENQDIYASSILLFTVHTTEQFEYKLQHLNLYYYQLTTQNQEMNSYTSISLYIYVFIIYVHTISVYLPDNVSQSVKVSTHLLN